MPWATGICPRGMQRWFNIGKSINIIHHINRIKVNMITSIKAEKAFGKIQHLFMTRACNKLGMERMHFNIIKATYYKLTSYPMVKCWSLSLEQDKDAHSHNSFSTHWKLLIARTIRQENEIKGIQTRREEIKLSLCMMWAYMRKILDSIKKLLELTNKCSKISGYKISIRKSVTFLYINNEISKKEIRQSGASLMVQWLKNLPVM